MPGAMPQWKKNAPSEDPGHEPSVVLRHPFITHFPFERLRVCGVCGCALAKRAATGQEPVQSLPVNSLSRRSRFHTSQQPCRSPAQSAKDPALFPLPKTRRDGLHSSSAKVPHNFSFKCTTRLDFEPFPTSLRSPVHNEILP